MTFPSIDMCLRNDSYLRDHQVLHDADHFARPLGRMVTVLRAAVSGVGDRALR